MREYTFTRHARRDTQFMMRFFQRKVPDLIAERVEPRTKQHRLWRHFQFETVAGLIRCLPRCQMHFVLAKRHRV